MEEIMDLKNINLEALTLDDCITVFERKNIRTVIENGKVVALVEGEKIEK